MWIERRGDWNASLRADELSAAVRGSKSGASTLANPEIDPSKLAPRVQKLAESQPGGKPAKLFQLGGESEGTKLVESAEQGRSAIKNFKPTSATGQKALQNLLQKRTGTGWIQTAKQSIGLNPKTDFIGAFSDFNKLPDDERERIWGDEAPAVKSFLQKQAAWQVSKLLASGMAVAAIGRLTGIDRSVIHLIIGGE